MRLLLDTHVFLWWTDNNPALSTKVQHAISDESNDCFLSIVSCWEIAIKASLGKLNLSQSVEKFIVEQVALNGFELLPVDFRHVAAVESLPFHHRDPFDRLLVAQARAEGLVLVTADFQISNYGVSVLW
ncbi:MAG TPA: type II toxin-antitoxin system VapC family toxin [Desulfuromonadales bacterium]|nr:type II toxin-antitoxin system VapC family toxin [Desulfuromonadales bacterium]